MVRTETAAPEPAGRTGWQVPVRVTGTAGVLRFFRLRDGGRCAVGFGSAEALASLLGPGQTSVVLSESALRDLAAPMGVHTLVLDPQLVAPPVTTPPVTAPPVTAPPAAPFGVPVAQLQHQR
ncbi:SAV_915 family protein [Kitasatospora herbaricolor]|uniref:Type III secretion system (T3SS) SseB-like protein n=1 Tax=Kitasatospora herbaricolor TaxID=68217 RepID=A0ABZ1W2T1_9ACTN|nr:SAV_915 family protein [Kitasatospora herbaricolor]